MLALDPPGRGRRHDRRDRRRRTTPARCAPATAARATSWSGMRVALADGTVAKSGGKVIKNVAGYDLAKLFTGSFGTLGAILEVSVRLHPLPPRHRHRRWGTRTTRALLARGAAALVARPPGAARPRRALGRAAPALVLARFGGAAPVRAGRGGGAAAARGRPRGRAGEDDEALWQAQRESQRSPAGLVVRVSALQTDLPDAAAHRRAPRRPLVGRAGLGLYWLRLDDGDSRRAGLRAARGAGPAPCSTARRPRRSPATAGLEPGAAALMRRVKERFDPKRDARSDGRQLGRRRARPQLDLIDDCVHCGFCLPTCPTYVLWGEEMDSPRGRIVLMKQGHEEISAPLVGHLDNCLGCMACVTACPSRRAVRQAARGRARAGGAQLRAAAARARPPPARVRAVHPARAAAGAGARRRPGPSARPAAPGPPAAPAPPGAAAQRRCCDDAGRLRQARARPAARALRGASARSAGRWRCSRAACSASSSAT